MSFRSKILCLGCLGLAFSFIAPAFVDKNSVFLIENEFVLGLTLIAIGLVSFVCILYGLTSMFFVYIYIPNMLTMNPKMVVKIVAPTLFLFKFFGTSEQYCALSDIVVKHKVRRG